MYFGGVILNIRGISKEVLAAIMPISITILILQFTLIHMSTDVFINFIVGVILTIVGFILFLIGIKISLSPIGELMGNSLMSKAKLWLIISFGIAIGFAVTIAEPGVQILAKQIDYESGGAIPKDILTITISIGVGIFLALALLRTIFKVSIIKIIIGCYILIFLLAIIAPLEFFAISFDASGVTTGPMTVPFILSLGTGMTAIQGSRNSSHDSLGLVALASIGPILSMLLLGVIYR